MNRFILKILLVLLPALVILVSVNYFGDAANLFSKNFEMKVAEGILSGSHVTNVSDYNERLLQRFIVTNSKLCPEVLVIGSSRTMEINSTYFTGKTFFNNSVSGASIEDLIAVCELYDKKGCHPKNMIIGLDPWTLNKNNGQTRWKSLTPEYNIFRRELNLDTLAQDENVNIYSQLISPSYFNGSLKALLHPKKPILTKQSSNDAMTRVNDGSVCYGVDHRNLTKAQIETKAKEFGTVGNIYSVEKFDELSPDVKMMLEHLTAKLKSQNVSVTFFLSPYNPLVYHIFETNKQYSQIMQSEAYYKSLAEKNNIRIIGSFDPKICEMDESFFYDGMHANGKGIAKILSGYQPK